MKRNLAYAEYWRNSLKDAGLGQGLLRGRDIERLHSIPSAEYEDGMIGEEVVEKLFQGEMEATASVKVVIRPLVFKARLEHTEKRGLNTESTIAPVIAFANIDRKGRIYPTLCPFVARDLLEPLENGSLSIGELSDLDLFLSISEIQPSEMTDEGSEERIKSAGSYSVKEWTDYLKYCGRLFESVSPNWPGENGDHVKIDYCYLQKDDNNGDGVSKSIINLYDDIRKTKPEIPLFAKFANDEPEDIIPCIESADAFELRVAHASSDYPLANAQRDALSNFLSIDDGDILAINGPPGTGKTTLLLSVVASLWAKSALNDQYPPVILAASNNNQAVTNIIDAFGKDFSVGTGPFAGRWLPEITSFGTYFPSNSKLEDGAKKYQTKLFFDGIETEDYVRSAKNAYLEAGRKAFSFTEHETIDSIVLELRDELKVNFNYLKIINNAWIQLKESEEKALNVCGDDMEAYLHARQFDIEAKVESIQKYQLNFDTTSKDLAIWEARITEALVEVSLQTKEVGKIQFLLDKAIASSDKNKFNLNLIETAKIKWRTYISEEFILYDVLDWIKPINRKRFNKAKSFLSKIAPGFPIDKITTSLDQATKIINAQIRTTKNNKLKIDKTIAELNVKKSALTAVVVQAEAVLSEKRNGIELLMILKEDCSTELTKLKSEMGQLEENINLIVSVIERLTISKTQWLECASKCAQDCDVSYESLDDADCKLDTSIRFKMFMLATHYWEGRWLQESSRLLSDKKFSKKLSLAEVKQAMQCRMMLTPCIVSTFYMLPKLMEIDCKGEDGKKMSYLYNFADLLIVDEAGQVLPEVAGASFSLAKKALVIGDIQQIEPIWAIQSLVDIGNLVETGLVDKNFQDDDYSIIGETGKTATSGSVMKIAQLASKFHYNPELERGMYLYEHYRCNNEIISYCNELCYKGNLKPKRIQKSITNGLPEMGFLHIDGVCVKGSTGSQCNQIEANVIANWIAANKDELEAAYQNLENPSLSLQIHQIIGIVTPFKRQKDAIYRACRAKGILVDPGQFGMTIGTVHALQGAERPVIIFSSTYSQSADGEFIDQKKSLLNVAVSRAQDSFLMFGDMNTFSNSGTLTPRGLLFRYLTKHDSNAMNF